jgi:hypothetical protein
MSQLLVNFAGTANQRAATSRLRPACKYGN